MTAVRQGVRPARAIVLRDAALPAVNRLLDADPVVNVVVASRVQAVRSLAAARLGGTMVGVSDGDELVGACFSGGNLLPIGGDVQTWDALASFASSRPCVCTSIVGRAEAVEVMWPRLATAWGAARTIRARQPLMVLDALASSDADDSVARAQPADLERYLAAAAAMFTEELGVSPHVAPGPRAFRSRVEEIIRSGRAFASFDFRGQVVFKAEIGAVSAHTAQIQGVWVRPDRRNRGIGTAALATVFAHALTLAPTVSLYVNDFNVPALRAYHRLGMREIATLSTVLIA